MRPALFIHSFILSSALVLAACSPPPPPAEPIRAVRVITVGEQAQGWSIDYAGEVRPRTESRLSFRVGGKMVSRPVDVGDSVKAGQVLASLDPQDMRLSQEAAKSGLEAARVNAEQAAADLKRFKELREQGFISAAELDRRDSTFKAAQAQYEQARAQAGMQSNQARYTTLVADMSGVVTAVEAEQHADQLRALEGKPGVLQVKVWGAGDAVVPATVREVAAAADPATRTFAVKADVGRAPVRLGQTATVSLAVPAAPGAFRLPLAAVFEQQGKAHALQLINQNVCVVDATDADYHRNGKNDPLQVYIVLIEFHRRNPGCRHSR